MNVIFTKYPCHMFESIFGYIMATPHPTAGLFEKPMSMSHVPCPMLIEFKVMATSYVNMSFVNDVRA